MLNKATLRKELLQKRKNLTACDRKEISEKIAMQLFQMKAYQEAKSIMLYMDYKNEVETGKILLQARADKKKIVLPYTTEDFQILPYYIESDQDLKTDTKGIVAPDIDVCEKADPKDIDLVVVPGVGFDRKGNRMGYGARCYDRFLPELRQDSIKVAIAFPCQIVEELPIEPHDIPMDKVLFGK